MPLNADQHATLLLIARRTIEAVVCGRHPPTFVVDDPELSRLSGVFVTVRTRGQLRGCIGRFVGDAPLHQLVARMAVAAATQDPRFANHRLRPHELCDCHITISILSPLERVANPLDFQIGTHGILVRSGQRTGCFLPQVGSDADWTAEQMLTQCCARKAGLAADAWRRGEVEVSRFTTEVVAEPELREPPQPSPASDPAVIVQPGVGS
jgi:AmmeMemoRadiSam system protein A